MGGLAVLYAATVADKLDEQTKEKLPSIDGAFAMCPLLDGEATSHRGNETRLTTGFTVPDRPNAVVTAIGKLLVKVAGKVPLLDGGPIGAHWQLRFGTGLTADWLFIRLHPRRRTCTCRVQSRSCVAS